MLIKVKNKEVADIPSLIRLTFRYVYEKDKMKAVEITLMEESIVSWMHNPLITDQQLYALQNIGKMLVKERSGGFKKRIDLFKKHKIDWRKAHRQAGFYDGRNKRVY